MFGRALQGLHVVAELVSDHQGPRAARGARQDDFFDDWDAQAANWRRPEAAKRRPEDESIE